MRTRAGAEDSTGMTPSARRRNRGSWQVALPPAIHLDGAAPSVEAPAARLAGAGPSIAGAGFEPAKAEPMRLQRIPFAPSGTPPGGRQCSHTRRGHERQVLAWVGLVVRV